jgi:predicted phosphoribosyltransferase
MHWTSQRALFKDRVEAGRRLGQRLSEYAGRNDVLVLGLPRGGMPVAEQIAAALGAPLDMLLVRKLGLPRHEELAMGAIASGGVVELDQALIRRARVSPEQVEQVVLRESAELTRREQLYRKGRARHALRGRTLILVDDGLATGATMTSAVRAARREGPSRVVVAVPVASEEACAGLARGIADECVCLERPEPFVAVGIWYERFDQTSDEEVIACLERSAEDERRRALSSPGSGAWTGAS